MYGWLGTIADIGLTTRQVHNLNLSEDVLATYLGGVGLAARLLYDRYPPHDTADSHDTPLALMTGPFTGTFFPGVGRVSLCARSPLSGAWGESSLGGNFGSALKAAGYDGLLIHGASESPIYLHISRGVIAIRDASDLWGRDTYETERILKQRHGAKCEVASIGTAAEHLVRYGSLNHRGSNSAGRCGMGAVLGAKRLKAIIAEGQREIPVADPARLAQIRRELIALYKDDWWVKTIRHAGTAWGTDVSFRLNDIPVRNWAWPSSAWEAQGERINGQAIEAAGYVVGHETCFRCPIGCKHRIHIANGDGADYADGAGPEYETVGALGAMLLVDDIRILCKASELCNRYGLDTISCGGTIAWAIESYERGLLTKADCDGRELRWGDGPLLLDLIGDIAARHGLGDLLAEGSRAAAARVGQGSEQYAIQVKGLELAMHHPRAMRGMELAYATGPRGASHNEGGGGQRDGMTLVERAEASVRSINRAQITGSAIFCSFAVGPLKDEPMAEAFTAVTGREVHAADLEHIGSRVWHLKRAFNLRCCGIGGEADTLPERVKAELPAAIPLADLLAAYYQARGLDASGKALRTTLEQFGLAGVADDLETAGG